MKDSFERLFLQIIRERDNDGVVVSLMQTFVFNAFEEEEIEAMFEAINRLGLCDSEDAEMDQETFLGVMIDIALEFERIDIARRAASVMNDFASPVFEYIKIAQHTKNEEDIRQARQSAMDLGEEDGSRKAQAFADLFLASHAPEDRARVEQLCLGLDESGFAALALGPFIIMASDSRSRHDYIRCIQLLEHSEEQGHCSDDMVDELFEFISPQEIGPWLAYVQHPRLHSRINRVLQTKTENTH